MRTVDFSVIYYTEGPDGGEWFKKIGLKLKHTASVCLTNIDKKKYENTRKVCLWHYQFIKDCSQTCLVE